MKKSNNNTSVTVCCGEQQVNLSIPEQQTCTVTEMIRNKTSQQSQSQNTTSNALFLIASKQDIQLTLEDLPRVCAYQLGMHIFLESRYCIGSLYANRKRIEYRQNMPTIVGTGLQKLALKILTDLHEFENKPIPNITLAKLHSLDACVGTLRSWNMDCDLNMKHKTRSTHKISITRANRFTKHKNDNVQKKQNPLQRIAVVKNNDGHRITIPDMSLFAGFFHDNRQFISQAMQCLPLWMRDLPNARGICLNAAVLFCAQAPGYYDAMTMQRVTVRNYTQTALQKKFNADKKLVMSIKLQNRSNLDIMGTHIEDHAAYMHTTQASNLLLGCNKTFVFLGSDITADGSLLYDYTLAGNCANITSDTCKSKAINKVKEDVSNMIYKMRFLQAAMYKHQVLHMQKARLLSSLGNELHALQQKVDQDGMALLRMLQHAFSSGIHALAVVHT